MPPLPEPIARLRWLAVPIASYLAITLVLPVANGAARRADFARHAAWLLAGCVAVVAVALAGGALIDVVHANLGRKR